MFLDPGGEMFNLGSVDSLRGRLRRGGKREKTSTRSA